MWSFVKSWMCIDVFPFALQLFVLSKAKGQLTVHALFLSSSFVLVISVRCQLQWSLIYAWPKDSINNRVVQSSCLTSIRFY